MQSANQKTKISTMKIVVLIKLKIDFIRFMAQLIGSLAGPEWRLKFDFQFTHINWKDCI